MVSHTRPMLFEFSACECDVDPAAAPCPGLLETPDQKRAQAPVPPEPAPNRHPEARLGEIRVATTKAIGCRAADRLFRVEQVEPLSCWERHCMLDDPLVEERHAAFEPCRHAHPIHALEQGYQVCLTFEL